MKMIRRAGLVSWLALMATGLYQYFFPRPVAAAAYADMEHRRTGVMVGRVVRDIHQIAAWAAIVLPLVACLVFIFRRNGRHVARSAALLVIASAAMFTGMILPWDQMALHAVTLGTDMAGFRPVFGEEVRLDLLSGVQIGANSFRWILAVHMIFVPAIMIVTIAIATVPRLRSRR